MGDFDKQQDTETAVKLSISEKYDLLNRVRGMKEAKISEKDKRSLKEMFTGLKQYSISNCKAIIADKLSCCMRKKDRSIKLYQRGQDQIDKRLDIVKLIRTSLELQILKGILLS